MLLTEARKQWPALYDAVFNLVGEAAFIMAVGDSNRFGKPTVTSGTTVRRTTAGLALTITPYDDGAKTTPGAPSGWTTPLDLNNPLSWQGVIPVIRLDGSTETLDVADNAAFSSATEMTLSLWVRNLTAANQTKSLWIQGVTASSLKAFSILVNVYTPGLQRFYINNVTSPNTNQSYVDGAVDLLVGQWTHICAVWDGTTGASASNGLFMYINGVDVSTGRTDNGSGVSALYDPSASGTIGGSWNGSAMTQFFYGDIAGGPLGPMFSQKALDAAEVKALYELGRDALGL